MRIKYAWRAFAALLLSLGSAACSVAAPPPTTPTPLPATLAPFDACTVEQGGTLVPPTLIEVQPAEPAPGAEITVVASGGYVQCGSAVNESARDFLLYLGENWVGVVSCYVNRCEGKAQLPQDLAPGVHVLEAEGGSQLEFEVK